jgi:hypothetical protein
VTHFLGWLSEMESNVDNLEFQVESSSLDAIEKNLPPALDALKVNGRSLWGQGQRGSMLYIGTYVWY